MSKNRASKRQTASLSTAIVTGAGVALVISILGSILCVALLSNETVEEGSTHIMITILWGIAALAGSLSATALSGRNLLAGLITGLAYFLATMGIGILFFSSNLGGALGCFLSVIAGCLVCSLLVLNVNRRASRKKRYKV